MYRTRSYEPDEVRRILRRAAELQDAENLPAEPAEPLTLEQIEHLARAAGIAQGLVARAAGAEEEPLAGVPVPRGEGFGQAFRGGPGRIVLERTVRGSVGPANHARIVKRIRQAMNETGRSEVLGDSLTWSARHGRAAQGGYGRELTITIEPEAGAVSIRVEENLRGLAGALFGGIMGGAGGGAMGFIVPLAMSMSRSVFAIPAFIFLWVAGMWALARSIYVSRLRARSAELTSALDAVAAFIESEQPPPTRARIVAGKAVEEREAEEEQAAIEASAPVRRVRDAR